MTATPMISPTRAKAMLDSLTANFNSLFINIYTGALEATCGTATSGTQLAAPQFGATAFGASVDGVSTGIMTATANAITSDTNATAIVTPADGPSFGMAPAGTWIWMSFRPNAFDSTPSCWAWERT